MKFWAKVSIIFILPLFFTISLNAETFEFDARTTLLDTPTDIMGLQHIALSVQDLDRALAFYQGATGFQVISRMKIQDDPAINRLFQRDNVVYDRAVLQAPNWILELTEYQHNDDLPLTQRPIYGPGMSHTCYQSPASDPGHEKFVAQGARVLNRNQHPVYSPTYGVSYIYAYDPEGNVMELEQLKGKALDDAGYPEVAQGGGQNIWMSQVSLFTHDRDRLMHFYEKVFAIKPSRVMETGSTSFADNLFDLDNAKVKIGWFRLDQRSKVMEILQFINPATPKATEKQKPSDLGYSFTIEVRNIEKEYQRLSELGVGFLSKPQALKDYLEVFAHDIDGNVFSLRQMTP